MSAGVPARRLPAPRSPVHDDSDGREDAMETGFALSQIDTTTPHPRGCMTPCWAAASSKHRLRVRTGVVLPAP